MSRSHVFLLLLAPALAAQHPCFVNLVPNGDFESILVNPWTASGPVTAQPASFRTNGVQTSFCMQLVPTQTNSRIVLAQPTPFALQSGQRYEFALDWYAGSFGTLDIGVVDNGNRTSLGTASGSGYLRISLPFTAQATANLVLEIWMTGRSAQSYRVDNANVRVARDVVFNVDGPRAAGAVNTLRVLGPGNGVAVVFLSAGFAPVPLPIPGCQHEFLLALPAPNFQPFGLGQNGLGTAPLLVPLSASGLALHWQAAAAPASCSLGCPVMIGFP